MCKTAIVAAALTLPHLALAGGVDPLRCDATAMRKQGQLLACLSGCQSRNTRNSNRLGVPQDATQCQNSCNQRFGNSMNQLDQQPMCGGDGNGSGGPPDPNLCQARVLRAQAADVVCVRACFARASGRRAVPVTTCGNGCAEQYSTTIDQLFATSICAGQTPPITMPGN
jgi:hypothetical protein